MDFLSWHYSLLHWAELHSDNQFCLCRHVLEHINFQPSQHVRTQKVMELLDLVLFRDIGKLLQETFQVTVQVMGQLLSHVDDSIITLKAGKTYLNRSGVRKLSRWKSSSRLF